MWFIRCDVRIRTARSGGPGVCARPGHHRRNRQQEPVGNRLWGEIDTARGSTGGAEESRVVHRARGHDTEGVRSPGTDSHITEADHKSADITVPASGVRSLNI